MVNGSGTTGIGVGDLEDIATDTVADQQDLVRIEIIRAIYRQ